MTSIEAALQVLPQEYQLWATAVASGAKLLYDYGPTRETYQNCASSLYNWYRQGKKIEPVRVGNG